MTTSFALDSSQERVLNSVVDGIDIGRMQQTVGGLAGTGKTTVAGQLPSLLGGGGVAYVAYTGKAARVLRRKLPGQPTSTIHRLIYLPREFHCDKCPAGFSVMPDATMLEPHEEELTQTCHRRKDKCESCGVAFERREAMDPSIRVIVVDEASMVGEDIYNDLLSYRVPIVFFGDHGQLPPVRGSLNLMERLDFELEKNYRQEEASGIVPMALQARRTGGIPYGEFGLGSRKVRDRFFGRTTREFLDETAEWDDQSLILCATNRVRVSMNSFVRQDLEMSPHEPQIGDRVICLRNDRERGVVNGSTGRLLSIKEARNRRGTVNESVWDVSIEVDGENGATYENWVSKEQFGAEKPLVEENAGLWDFGYAMTVHKAQGSEAARVLLLDGGIGWMPPDTQRRWLYTGVTRAQRELTVVG